MFRHIIRCPVCYSLKVKFRHYLFDDNSLSWDRTVTIHTCRECGQTFSDLSFKIEESYNLNYYVFQEYRKPADIAFAQHCCQWLNEKSSMSSKRLLDVGCGKGFFCEAANASGAIVTGLEPCPLIAQDVEQKRELNIMKKMGM